MNQFIHTQMHLDLQIKIKGKKKQQSFHEAVDLPIELEPFSFGSPLNRKATGAEKDTDCCELMQHNSESDLCLGKDEI